MPKPALTPAQRARAYALLEAEFQSLGTNAAVARKTGISRGAISTVRAGKYPANPDGVLADLLAALDRYHCPYLGCEVERQHCVDINSGPTPTWNPGALSQRRACQTCPNKPKE